MSPLPIYVGYDPREHGAWEVCRASIERRASAPVVIKRLHRATLIDAGLYRRQAYPNPRGGWIDAGDLKPFSTEFSFSRFLVPALNLFEGWALFCDCDFLFTADIARLFDLADDRYAAMCVKHRHEPAETVKMDGVLQTRYRRKNWSSLVLWNCGHKANRHLSLDCVNRMPGQWLHAFDWLPDEKIGALPIEWNWLSGVSEPLPDGDVPCGVHFTLGGPWFAGCQDVPFADLWRRERDSRRSPGRPNIHEIERAILANERHVA